MQPRVHEKFICGLFILPAFLVARLYAEWILPPPSYESFSLCPPLNICVDKLELYISNYIQIEVTNVQFPHWGS